jgi:uncharacterized protein
MTLNFPYVSAIFAGVFGLLAALLTANVIVHRVRTRVTAGDGGDAGLAQSIRAHGNFIEQAPLGAVVLSLAEVAGARSAVVIALGALLLASRLASAIALNGSLGLTTLRQIGGGTAVIGMAAVALALLLALAGIR